jgi:feruloyl esterase
MWKLLLRMMCGVMLVPCMLRLSAQMPCEQLVAVHLPDAKILSAKLVPAGELASAKAFGTVPAHCDVQGLITPTSDSVIHFELWLPSASDWNGKYMQIGSGGWGGIILDRQFVKPIARGYAVAATDDGHSANGDETGKFTLGHPQKLIDFGYRAVHLTSSDSRIVLDAFYGRQERHAYFVGCSDGGREALMEAERFPEDFDGIVAGAPANHWTHHFTGFIWNERALFSNGESVLPAQKLPLIEKAALAACDKLDGVEDGLIEDPRACHFDPSVLECKNGDGADCLTAAQIEAVQKIYAGPKDPVTGEQIYPGYAPGTEAEIGAWQMWLLGRVQAQFGNSNFADATYENANWDWHTSDLHKDLQLTEQKVGPYVDSYNPDLRSFRDRGGKLLQYHGWGDAAIAPQDSIDFYGKVQEFLSTYPDSRKHTSEDIHDFYRLFMVPGMGHCGGGAGTGSFGNELITSPGVPQDPDHDIVLALDHWVVDGVAPDRIIATRPAGQPASIAIPEPMTRPLCAFPAVARYRGSGSVKDAASFGCVAPQAH